MRPPLPQIRPLLRTAGFTLVELIVVIVILSVLAATALPRFIDLGKDARIATLEQLAATLRSTSTMVYGKCLMQGCLFSGTEYVTINGVTRTVWAGYPIESSRSNVWWAINDLVNFSGLTYTHALPRAFFSVPSAPDPTNCRVTYEYQATSSPPVITITTSGC